MIFRPKGFRKKKSQVVVLAVPDSSLGSVFRKGVASDERVIVNVGDIMGLNETLVFVPVEGVVTVDPTGKLPIDLVGNEMQPFCLVFPDAKGRCPARFTYKILDFKNLPEVVSMDFLLEPSDPSELVLQGTDSVTVDSDRNPGGQVVLQDVSVDAGPAGNHFNATMIIIPTLVEVRFSPDKKSARFPGQTVGSMVTITTEGVNNENLVVAGPPSYLEDVISLAEIKVDVSAVVGRRQMSITVFSAVSPVADDLLRITFELSGTLDEDSSTGPIVGIAIGVLGIVAVVAFTMLRKRGNANNFTEVEEEEEEDQAVSVTDSEDKEEIDI